jgi:hypothetical protein
MTDQMCSRDFRFAAFFASTPDKLLARIVSEARGGRVLADVFGGSLAYVAQLNEQ